MTKIKWQEKIFSNTEINYYGECANCNTDLEKKYHTIVQNFPGGHQSGLIYTYTNEDGFSAPDDFGSRGRLLKTERFGFFRDFLVF